MASEYPDSAHKPMYKYSVGEKIKGKMQSPRNHRLWYSIKGEIAAEDDTDDLCVQVAVDWYRVRLVDREIKMAEWMEWPAGGCVWVFRDYISRMPAEGEPESSDEEKKLSAKAAGKRKPNTKVGAVVQHPGNPGITAEVQGRVMYDTDPDSDRDVVGVLAFRVRHRTIWGVEVDTSFEEPEGAVAAILWVPRGDVYCLPERAGDGW
ncbi:hypothetical protein GGTG_09286 [Gaeumannomyces tritici R3-111a-1]|uniref:Uncharacterized protein n=1 Tax=Gaeumannomyces tritici (strain R3-111a-1) TaxID=644352 RepID=J3P6Y9_GAET3|nr:hypothetical protein GGTG_09286 [Gaeumannomyces tritici R3-111a-1]EJT72420.1 hypothetical protein GGTG_09286 [Gaeumannomyces tritici R3-111a-1]